MSTAGLIFIVIGVWAVLIWAGIAWVHYLADDNGPLDKEGLVGVRGWLTLLVGGLVGWGPIISIGRFYQEFSQAEGLYPAIKRLPEWHSYTSVMWVLVLLITAWQVHVGWRMCRDRSPVVIQYLKKYLLLSPLSLLVLGFPNVLVLKADYPASEMLGGAVGVGVVNALWYWYISKSRRVARTYNLPDAALRPASMAPRPAHRGGVEMVASSSTKEPLAAPLEAYRGVTVPTVSTRLEPSSVEEKISQHRLERSLGSSLDEDLYSRCLAECEFDHLRAAAMYQRLKAGLGHSNR